MSERKKRWKNVGWKQAGVAAVLALASAAPIIVPDDAKWIADEYVLYAYPLVRTGVGIGTSHPVARLNIATGTDAAPAPGRNGYLMLGGKAGPANLILDNNEIMARWAYAPGTLHLQHEGGEVRIHGGTEGDAFRITESGQVIVGEPNGVHPDYELQVEGGVLAQEVRVTMDGWADDVLSEPASARDLLALEDYVHEHGHLPEIPAEDEILRKGADLGAVTRGLLVQVERLTLHTIRQEREIERLRREVRRLSRTGKREGAR